jgi:hypothetical protein
MRDAANVNTELSQPLRKCCVSVNSGKLLSKENEWYNLQFLLLPPSCSPTFFFSFLVSGPPPGSLQPPKSSGNFFLEKGLNWACGVVQVVECLPSKPSKHEAPSSSPSTTEKKKVGLSPVMRVGLNPWENQVQGEWLGTGTVTQENSGIAAVVPITQNSILSSHSPRYS